MNSRKRILVADHDEQSRSLLSEALSARGYEVETAASGKEALAAARRRTPDLVISDILMPEMDGFALCRALKADERFADVPFVFYTAAFVDRQDERLAMELGASRFIVRPIDPGEFLRIIEDVVRTYEAGELPAFEGGAFTAGHYRIEHDRRLLATLERKLQELDQERAQYRASEARFRGLIETLSDCIWELDAQMRFAYITPRVEALLGYRPEQMLGRSPQDFDYGGAFSGHAQLAEAFGRREPILGLDLHCRHAEGSLVVMETNATPLFDEQGTFLGYRGTSRDATERRRAEESFRLANMVVENSPTLAYRLLLETNRLEYVSGNVRRYGYDPDELMRGELPLEEIVHPDDRQRVTEQIRRACLEGGGELEREYRIVGRDGRVYWMLERSSLQCDAAGCPTRIQGLATDVTVQKINDLKLHKLNRALQTLSQCNQVLVHAESEAALLEQVCGIFVETGGYLGAWVAYPSGEEGMRVQFQAGAVSELLEKWSAAARTAPAQDPMRIASATGEVFLEQRVSERATDSPWVGLAAQHHLGAFALLPLMGEEQSFGALGVAARESDAFDPEEMRLLLELSGDLGYGIATRRSEQEKALIEAARRRGAEQLRKNLMDTIGAISLALEKRDPYTAGHQARVAQLAGAIAREMGLPDERVEGIRLGALVHDIGKIAVPSEILGKPAHLSEVEEELVHEHPSAGHEILRDVEFPWPLAMMILQHHERMNGSGYPSGLVDGQISLEARILAVADVVEAMATNRPYRPGLGLEDALDEIGRNRGTLYDEAAADACLSLFREKNFRFSEPQQGMR